MSRAIKYITGFVLVTPAIYLAIVWDKLPAKVPLHYNFRGVPDRYGDKIELLLALAIMIAINTGVYFLLVNIHRIDPKKKYTADNLPRMRKLAFAIALFVTALACFIIYSSAHPGVKFNSKLVDIGVGILFMVTGNYLYNIKPNYFAGIRLPWTLENEDNWKRTHLMAGKLWFGGGFILVIGGLLLPDPVMFIFIITIVVMLTIIPIIYSYRLYKRQDTHS